MHVCMWSGEVVTEQEGGGGGDGGGRARTPGLSSSDQQLFRIAGVKEKLQ